MQIQPSLAAGAAAGSVSQSGSKDRTSGSASEAAAQPSPAAVEQVARSEQSSADRDAQGAGPALSFKKGNRKKSDSPEPKTESPAHESLPVKSPEPPSELDLIG